MAPVAQVAPSPASLRGAGGGAARPARRRSLRGSILLMIARRIVVIPIAILIVASLSFLLVGAAPGDPARTVLGEFATKPAVARFNHQYGLDQSLGSRYLHYLSGLVHGSLGTSYYSSNTVASQIGHYLGPTIELVVLAMIVAVVLGVLTGVLGSYTRFRVASRLARWWTGFVQSVPDFALGLTLVYLFFFLLRVAPAPIGQISTGDTLPAPITHAVAVDSLLRGQFGTFSSAVGHLVLPVATLGLVYSATFSRMTSALLNDALQSPQVEFARACGLSERTVLRYALLSVRGPIITYVAILTGFLIGGEAVIETVFSWDGLGQWALTGMLKLDLPVIQGFILVAAAITLVVYLVLDVVVMLLDPRLRNAPGKGR